MLAASGCEARSEATATLCSITRSLLIPSSIVARAWTHSVQSRSSSVSYIRTSSLFSCLHHTDRVCAPPYAYICLTSPQIDVVRHACMT